ncbi:DUF5664 domain-containing protein [Alteriqipengyuania flavescens]|uniref:dATP/dGTP diphosphohydrolase domain-containing protein n=1 Tax=Alteriqipengyuania flavescens TaxID=3053610 RepID=UPI0025B3ABEB|nr:dATP/dGTP diphosphohydrolase domain-containing protein [Alteriqipengyuania flavescens]WJY17655.1 DUF5664 domain-containing protein [Alteriqipengyuania flavescens]WJY23598.1 DUF5664 domain-containing protein [Alteriqipengyuania flavescens]
MTKYETGPVDPSLPMELDDGTPVELVKECGDELVVRYAAGFRAKDPLRGEPDNPDWVHMPDWTYERATGLKSGCHDAAAFHTLRNVRKGIGNAGGLLPSLPEAADARNGLPMAEGLLDYFPNALAEVSRLSFDATQQHHPEEPMHWDRSKSTDHANKIMRHLVDRGGRDDKGHRHSTMVAWRALAMLQEELERDEGLPPSRASRNAPTTA